MMDIATQFSLRCRCYVTSGFLAFFLLPLNPSHVATAIGGTPLRALEERRHLRGSRRYRT